MQNSTGFLDQHSILCNHTLQLSQQMSRLLPQPVQPHHSQNNQYQMKLSSKENSPLKLLETTDILKQKSIQLTLANNVSISLQNAKTRFKDINFLKHNLQAVISKSGVNSNGQPSSINTTFVGGQSVCTSGKKDPQNSKDQECFKGCSSFIDYQSTTFNSPQDQANNLTKEIILLQNQFSLVKQKETDHNFNIKEQSYQLKQEASLFLEKCDSKNDLSGSQFSLVLAQINQNQDKENKQELINQTSLQQNKEEQSDNSHLDKIASKSTPQDNHLFTQFSEIPNEFLGNEKLVNPSRRVDQQKNLTNKQEQLFNQQIPHYPRFLKRTSVMAQLKQKIPSLPLNSLLNNSDLQIVTEVFSTMNNMSNLRSVDQKVRQQLSKTISSDRKSPSQKESILKSSKISTEFLVSQIANSPIKILPKKLTIKEPFEKAVRKCSFDLGKYSKAKCIYLDMSKTLNNSLEESKQFEKPQQLISNCQILKKESTFNKEQLKRQYNILKSITSSNSFLPNSPLSLSNSSTNHSKVQSKQNSQLTSPQKNDVSLSNQIRIGEKCNNLNQQILQHKSINLKNIAHQKITILSPYKENQSRKNSQKQHLNFERQKECLEKRERVFAARKLSTERIRESKLQIEQKKSKEAASIREWEHQNKENKGANQRKMSQRYENTINVQLNKSKESKKSTNQQERSKSPIVISNSSLKENQNHFLKNQRLVTQNKGIKGEIKQEIEEQSKNNRKTTENMPSLRTESLNSDTSFTVFKIY